MSRELTPFSSSDQGDEKIAFDAQTLIAFARAASDVLVQNIIQGDNVEARELVTNLATIQTGIMGLSAEKINELFARYKEIAAKLFKDEPENRLAVFNLLSIASRMVHYIHRSPAQLTTTGDKADKGQAEKPRPLVLDIGIFKALGASGFALLARELVRNGIQFGRYVSSIISNPYGSCMIHPDTESIASRVTSLFIDQQPTRSQSIMCRSLDVISRGLDSVVDRAENSNVFGFMVVLMVFIVIVMTIFRIIRYTGMSAVSIRFSGLQSDTGDDIMEDIDEMTQVRLSQSPLRHRISPRFYRK
jgi:hypothetical protein